MNKQQAQEYLRLIKPEAARELVEYVAPELDEIAARVSAYGLSSGSRRALGIIAQIGAELSRGAVELFSADRWHAGSALLRQIVEVEYILFLFSTDETEALLWLNAPPQEARKLYSPSKMRERSQNRFNAEEYSLHCEIGGHPRLKGACLLRERLIPVQNSGEKVELFTPSALWVDLGQHVERMWTFFSSAVRSISPSNVYPERFQAIDERIQQWHTDDPFPPTI